jgi:uncharacterized BrkB/YihY/UPF0761 family membrane protein
LNPAERTLRVVDRFQQARRPTAFGFGVVKKYGDDRAGQLAALITYYGFTAVFPLLLLLTTVLGFVLRGNPGAQKAVLGSALADFPIIGNQLTENVHSLHGTALGLVIGCLGLLYGSLGIAQILQFAMAQVWNIPGVERPGYLPRMGRGLLLILALGLGLLLSTGTAALVGFLAHGPVAWVAGLIGSAVVNTALYLACFRITTPEVIPLRQLVPGCLFAGPAWTGLQTGGGVLVAHELRHATQVYGFFGTVLGLLWWIFLGAQITMYAAEANVVRARRLWPRTLMQPPLNSADRQVLGAIAEQEERRPEQHVKATFDAAETPAAPEAAPEHRAEHRAEHRTAERLGDRLEKPATSRPDRTTEGPDTPPGR